MRLEQYVEDLKRDDTPSSYVELDKDAEIQYMRTHLYIFKKTVQAIPVSSKTIRILDIGPTPFTMFLKKIFPNNQIWALDRTGLLRDRFAKANVQMKICDLDGETIPFEDDYFDVVIFTEVLEHVFAPPTQILKEIKRIMRPKGKLIISVPNIASLSKRIGLLKGISPLENPDSQMRKDWVHGHGHIHEYTREEILSLIKAVNLNALNVRMLSGNMSYLYMLSLLPKFKLRDFIYRFLIRAVPEFRDVIHIVSEKHVDE